MKRTIYLECIKDFIVCPPETLVFKKGEIYQAKLVENQWVALGENLRPTCIFHSKNIEDDDEYFQWFNMLNAKFSPKN